MLSRFILVLLLAVPFAGVLRAEDHISLMGWAEFGGVSRALISELPENRQYIVRSDHEVAGWLLLRLDIVQGRAWVRRGTNFLTVDLPSAAGRGTALAQFLHTRKLSPDYAGPWPPGYEPELIRLHRAGLLKSGDSSGTNETGQAASGRYIGALRSYLRTLPEEEREPFQRELQRYSAGSIGGGNPQNSEIASATPTPTVPIPGFIRPGDETAPQSTDVPQADSSLLQRILSSPIPEVGSLIGGGEDGEVAALRSLLRATGDSAIQLRLRQELAGFSSPPIGAYLQDSAGNWFDPAALGLTVVGTAP